jgi:putative SOS response-associated peptidase YedK
MCGIATNTKPKKQIEDRFSAKIAKLDYAPIVIAKAFANDVMPVITAQNDKEIQFYEWGLLPTWANGDDAIKKLRAQTINARCETVFEKPSFKDSIIHKRCLILCDGFIEYQHNGKHKQAYYVSLKNNQLFAMAGIYSIWQNAVSDQIVYSFSMLTVPANELMSIVHNSKKRMPLILQAQDEQKWLHEKNETEIKKMFQIFPSDNMKAHTIDNAIGKKNINKNDLFLLTKKEVVSQGRLF